MVEADDFENVGYGKPCMDPLKTKGREGIRQKFSPTFSPREMISTAPVTPHTWVFGLFGATLGFRAYRKIRDT